MNHGITEQMSPDTVAAQHARSSGLKKWFWRSLGFGVGLGLVFCTSVGTWIWYMSRPKPPEPWNNKLIKASYYSVKTDSSKNLEFLYVLENTGNSDYRLEKYSVPRIAGKTEDTDSFVWFGEEDFQLGLPVYIPAHKKTRIDLVMKGYTVDETYPKDDSETARDEYYKKIADYVTNKLPNLDGFVIYDEASRTEIDLPNGWTEYSKKHSGSSKPDTK